MKNASLPTLHYLFKFLDAYDFASEGGEDIAEDNKTIINASVLGKVFEKINGYKDGSIFTPGFITMYMSRQSLRPAVIQKFNEHFKTNGIAEAATFEELYNRVDKVEIKTANEIVNSLRVCDPAVGSGHFLVSALNELILIKSELGILADATGKRLRDYEFTIENDELIITDEHGLFVYNHLNKESQRVQETIFGERQTIIENCLFGVDINPNSVKICRLRLWIELLKSSYYKAPAYAELETLPNIDINIKCGNSLISRYALDADIKKALKRSKWNIKDYQIAIMNYRNARSKDEKRAMEDLIATIKTDFETEVSTSDKRFIKLSKTKGELFKLTNQGQLFEKSKKEMAEWNKKVAALSPVITKLEQEIDEIKNNVIYKNAFEWRFEFPEVLNDEGDFVGFDVVMGNPPYVFARDNFSSKMKSYFVENYQTTQYQVNLYFLFIEKTIALMRKSGEFSLIVPNSLLMVSSAKHLRKHLLNEVAVSEIINLMGQTFEGINVEAIIISGIKVKMYYSNKISIYVNEGTDFILTQSKEQGLFMQNDGSELTVFSNEHNDSLISKLRNGSEDLNDLVLIKAGLQAYESGKGNPKQTPEDVKNRPYDYSYKFDENTYEYLEGKDVQRYQIKWSGTFLQYGNNLAAPRTFDIFSGNKIIIREITGKHPFSIIAAFSDEIFLFNRSNIAIVEKEKPLVQLKYILAILNSKLLSHYFITNTAKSVRQLFPKLILEDLRKFPIKVISSSDQQPFIQLVDQILEGKKQGHDTLALEQQVDELVYGLYGITEEERRVIEGE
jgi:type II restriction/modification system DNA methylase subunit YeeA